MRFAVETWAPEYGAGLAGALDDEPTADVELDIEVPAGSWTPRPAAAPPGIEVVFVDGVSRIDAQVWVEEPDGSVKPGVCATYAAGAVRCDGRATITGVDVRRGLFTPSGAATAIETSYASYPVRAASGEQLSMAVIERMRALEAEVARSTAPAAMIVLDGLLWGRTDIPGAIGYVKSHHAPYLPPELSALVGRLAPGERTPLFLVTTRWSSRFSWYLRLPGGGDGHPWSGVVRCEVSPDLTVAEAGDLADLAGGVLPGFASSRHRDPRAPQNLYPIGGLERELRRRCGDTRLLYRSLLATAAS